MKKFRILLVLCFLLSSVGIGAVSAQDSQTGYIPLLAADYNTAIPREETSHLRLQFLLPELLKAQHQGLITSFEPDYYGGFVKVTYSAGFNASEQLGVQMVSSMMDAVTPPPSGTPDTSSSDTQEKGTPPPSETLVNLDGSSFDVQGAVTPPPSEISPIHESTYTPWTYIRTYSNCVEMDDLGANAHVLGTLTASGQVVAIFDATADSSGYLWACFSGFYSTVVPGYVVNFKIYNSVGTYLKTITATIPRITFKTYNLAQAIVTGTATAGKPFTAYWSQHNLDAGNTYTSTPKTGTVSSTGAWSVDFGTQIMRGGSWVGFDLPVTANLVVSNSFWLPYLYCELGGNWCELYNIPNTSVSISITHAGVTHKFSGKTNHSGYFDVYLVNSNQEPIFLSAGDLISGTGANAYLITTLTVLPHPTTDKITGSAPANNYFWVELRTSGNWYDKWTHSDSAGNYVANFSGIVDIPVGPILVEVPFTNRVTGNVTYYVYSTGF